MEMAMCMIEFLTRKQRILRSQRPLRSLWLRSHRPWLRWSWGGGGVFGRVLGWGVGLGEGLPVLQQLLLTGDPF